MLLASAAAGAATGCSGVSTQLCAATLVRQPEGLQQLGEVVLHGSAWATKLILGGKSPHPQEIDIRHRSELGQQ